jgi:actin-related protein
MWNDDETEAMIIDNGSGMMRAGYSGNCKPEICFPTVIGRPKSDPMGCIKSYGEDAWEKRGDLSLSSPIANGIIENWDDMTKIWEQIYSELKDKPTERAVFLTEPITNPMENREKMAQTFFETFQVPAFYLQVTAPLALMTTGRNTGLVFDCGEGVTHFAPIWEGECSKNLVKTMNFAGGDLTRFLDSSLAEGSSTGAEYVQEIKEKKCYVALDYHTEMLAFENDKSKQTSYELPDLNTIALGNERFRCPEALFMPSIVNKGFPGVHEVIHNTIQEVPEHWDKSQLYENILLSGGSTMLPGLQERLTKEVTALAGDCKVRCIAPPERK